MGFFSESFDGVVGVRTIDPDVAVHPDAEVELHAAGCGLFADETQHGEIAVAFCVGELRDAYVVAGHGEEERISEEEVGVGDVADEVVSDSEGEVEAIEAVSREHGEIAPPHLVIVVPGLVLDFADEETGDAAHLVCRLFGEGWNICEGDDGIFGLLCAIGEVEQSVCKGSRGVSAGEGELPACGCAGRDAEHFGSCRAGFGL